MIDEISVTYLPYLSCHVIKELPYDRYEIIVSMRPYSIRGIIVPKWKVKGNYVKIDIIDYKEETNMVVIKLPTKVTYTISIANLKKEVIL
jgi:hypothetical protein